MKSKKVQATERVLTPEIGLILLNQETQKVSVVLTNLSTELEEKVILFLTKFRFDLDFSYEDYTDGYCLVIQSHIGTDIEDFLKHLARQNGIKYVFELDLE
jgi:hypothetical protein